MPICDVTFGELNHFAMFHFSKFGKYCAHFIFDGVIPKVLENRFHGFIEILD